MKECPSFQKTIVLQAEHISNKYYTTLYDINLQACQAIVDHGNFLCSGKEPAVLGLYTMK